MLRIATYITANLPNLAARLASIMPDHAFLTLLPLSHNVYAILKTHRLTLFSKNFSHFTWLILDENSYESSDTLILELHNTYRKFDRKQPIQFYVRGDQCLLVTEERERIRDLKIWWRDILTDASWWRTEYIVAIHGESPVSDTEIACYRYTRV